ncbi:MAG: hypothetical protein ABIR66_08950 [Saprospiraceae bacterium]
MQLVAEYGSFEIPNTAGELKAGSYADVKLHFLHPKQALVVPTSAVVSTLEKRFVIRVLNTTTQWIDVGPGIKWVINWKYLENKSRRYVSFEWNEEINQGKK